MKRIPIYRVELMKVYIMKAVAHSLTKTKYIYIKQILSQCIYYYNGLHF